MILIAVAVALFVGVNAALAEPLRDEFIQASRLQQIAKENIYSASALSRFVNYGDKMPDFPKAMGMKFNGPYIRSGTMAWKYEINGRMYFSQDAVFQFEDPGDQAASAMLGNAMNSYWTGRAQLEEVGKNPEKHTKEYSLSDGNDIASIIRPDQFIGFRDTMLSKIIERLRESAAGNDNPLQLISQTDQTLDGESVLNVKMEDAKASYEFVIDVSNKQLVFVRRKNFDSDMYMEITFANYRNFGEISIPCFVQEKLMRSANDAVSSTTFEIDSIDVNPTFSQDDFIPDIRDGDVISDEREPGRNVYEIGEDLTKDEFINKVWGGV
ncbi:MAG: hypothetical protein GC154_13950 [bacterium]|nr:hypothetical protein [bacterium]